MSKDKEVTGSTFDNFSIPKATSITVDANRLQKDAGRLQQIEDKIQQLEKEKDYLLSVFGIWATLVVFISVEFSFLKALSSGQEFVGFSLVLSGLLLGFNIALDLLSRVRFNNTISRGHKFFYGFTILLLIIGYVIMYFGKDVDKKNMHDDVYGELERKYVKLYENHNQRLEREVKQNISYLKLVIAEIKLELQEIQANHKIQKS